MTGRRRGTWRDDTPEGFAVPVYHAALKPRLALGAHQDVTAGLFGLATLAFIWRLWPVLPLAAILQGIAVWGTRQDERWFQKVERVIRYKLYYKA
jgi:type IV secretory pathway TrbD component